MTLEQGDFLKSAHSSVSDTITVSPHLRKSQVCLILHKLPKHLQCVEQGQNLWKEVFSWRPLVFIRH